MIVSKAISMEIHKVYFHAGIIDVRDNKYLVKRFHLDEGMYLSEQGRICSFRAAARFNKREDVVNFFNSWHQKNSTKKTHYKLEVIEFYTRENVDLELFDDSHPLCQITKNEGAAATRIALAYFFDFLHTLKFSKSTFLKYKRLLARYEIDIDQRVGYELNLQAKSQYIRSKYFEEHNQELSRNSEDTQLTAI